MKIYINQLYRYGDTKAHSYCSPIFKCEAIAELVKVVMVAYRGGKYEAETKEFELKDADTYYLAEIFTENDENKEICLFDDISKADEWLSKHHSSYKKKLTTQNIKNEIINITILDAHIHLDRLSFKAQEKLRDLYEQYLRKYYYY